MADPPPQGAPPPTYAVSQPQILITPLPDVPSFFWGRTVQGEVFVKGLGDGKAREGVKSLTIKLQLVNTLPNHPDIPLHTFPPVMLYPPEENPTPSSSSPYKHPSAKRFPTSHRFTIPLPAGLPHSPSLSRISHSSNPETTDGDTMLASLPGTLNLSSSSQGEIKWSLTARLSTQEGDFGETVVVEGTPQEVANGYNSHIESGDRGIGGSNSRKSEIEKTVEKEGVKARIVLSDRQPRLGGNVKLGVEVLAKERQKTGVAGLSSQPDAAKMLRKLRRVRVELFRRIEILGSDLQFQSQSEGTTSDSTRGDSGSSCSPATSPTRGGQSRAQSTSHSHLMLLYTSGKSLRYPGSSSPHPPLRLLFTIPTNHIASGGGSLAHQIWGEISSKSPYHHINFFVRVSVGFGGEDDIILEEEIVIKPRVWNEPRMVILERGVVPSLGFGGGGIDGGDESMSNRNRGDRGIGISDEELAREAYRQKGLDTVGEGGTIRPGENNQEDTPPAWDSGPSHSDIHALSFGPPPITSSGVSAPGGLPTFLESEAQMASGEAPLLPERVMSERLVPVDFEGSEESRREELDGSGQGSGGELDTWVEYDGYETFSVLPPDMSASFGASGSMDPPQPDDEGVNVVGGMVARLGLEGAQGVGGMELMEHLGLGEGTRVVDLQDDLPPGIDEPSLPALPDFHSPTHAHSHAHTRTVTDGPRPDPHGHLSSPPSFAASEAAQAAGGVALGPPPQARRASLHHTAVVPESPEVDIPPPVPGRDAPPGYFPRNEGHTHSAGPPAYS